MTTKITLDEWLELEHLAMEASRLLELLHSRAMLLACQHSCPSREFDILNKIAGRAAGAREELNATSCYVQSEWTGGDSSDPRNTTLCEPHAVGISHSFNREEVEKYRNQATGALELPARSARAATIGLWRAAIALLEALAKGQDTRKEQASLHAIAKVAVGRTPDPVRVIACVRGGVLQEAAANCEIDFSVLDFDNTDEADTTDASRHTLLKTEYESLPHAVY